MQPRTRDDRSLGDLFADLSRETTTLLRQEISLASVEMGQKASAVGKDVGFLAIGGAVAYAGFLAFLAACILALDGILHVPWLAALIVALIVLVIGYVLVRRGLDNLRRTSLAPTQTLESLREDAALVKEHTR